MKYFKKQVWNFRISKSNGISKKSRRLNLDYDGRVITAKKWGYLINKYLASITTKKTTIRDLRTLVVTVVSSNLGNETLDTLASLSNHSTDTQLA